MSKSLVWVVLLVGLLGALAVVWSQLDGDAAPVPSTVGDDRDARSEAPAAAGLTADPAGEQTAEPAAPQREAVATQTADKVARTGPLVRVVVGKSGTPIPDASVYFLQLGENPSAELMEKLRAKSGDPMQALIEHGLALRTNPAGEVRLPVPEGISIVGATANGLSGMTNLRGQRDDTIVIELYPNVAIGIAVRDQHGQPLSGIPVGFRRDSTRQMAVLWSGHTEGPDGIATMAGTNLGRLRSPDATTAIAFLNFPHLAGPTEGIDLADPPTAPVELVMPPTGELEVIVEGVEPSATDGIHVTVQSRSGAAPELVPHAAEVLEDGTAVFKYIGLGMDLTLGAKRPASNEFVTHDAVGPIAPGQRVTVRFDLRSLTPVIVARLINEQGDAIAKQRLNMSLVAKSGQGSSSSSSSIETDDDGRVRVAVQDEYGRGAERTLTFTTSRNANRRLAHAVLPAALVPGDNDIGTLTLGRPPLVCSGVVVDAGGDPIAEARITVSQQVVTKSGGVDRSFWRQLSGLSTTSDVNGRFEVRGICNADRLGASARHDDYLPLSEQPFPPQDTTVRLVMQRAGTIEGSVVIPDGMAPHDLSIELYRGTEREDDTRPGQDGSFRFASLPPGTARVQVRLFGDFTPLHTVDKVEIRPGETARDPRLQGIDLAANISVVEFRVQDAAGAPVRDAVAVVLSRDERQSRFEGHMLPDGVAAIPSRDGVIDVLVYADGYRRVTMRGLASGQTIVLPRSLTASLRLPAGVSPATEPESLKVALDPVGFEPPENPEVVLIRGSSSTSSHGGSLPWQRSPTATCDAAGVATVQVPVPGDYRVEWTLWRNVEGRNRGKRLSPNATITVRDAAEAQEFDAQVTPEMLEAARKR